MLLVLAGLGASATGSASTVDVWHLTDVHVDPYYVVGSDTSDCYCETFESCPRMGKSCAFGKSTHPAGRFGSSEGNCASPQDLFTSAVRFMASEAPHAAAVYFTGDFAEAGASSPCVGPDSVAQKQLLDIIAWDFTAVRAALPDAQVFGCLGNHDSAPGDIYYSASGGQAWLYNNLSNSTWLPELEHDADAVATVRQGGYYAVRPAAIPGLTLISLNINYWVEMNPSAGTPGSGAYVEGQAQFVWFEEQLAAAKARGERVHILGHQTPGDVGGAQWVKGLWRRYANLVAEYNQTITGQFYGHVHVDEFGITRSCSTVAAGSAYVETTGIKWCSGGSNYAPGDVFGVGVDGECPVIPGTWTTDHAVTECETVCNGNATCLGFTMYFYPNVTAHECCFRAGSTSYKPVDPTSTARCYEKPSNNSCNGEPTGVLLPGPSLTEGYPATNPSVRLLQFDATTLELVDMLTYVADLHAANAAGTELVWKLEYSTKEKFGMADLSPVSFAKAVAVLAADNSTLWDAYMGKGDGSLYCANYTSATAPYPPKLPCTSCPQGPCKEAAIRRLNGTDILG